MRRLTVCLCQLTLCGCAAPEKPVAVDLSAAQAKTIPQITVRFHLASGEPAEGCREMTDRRNFTPGRAEVIATALGGP